MLAQITTIALAVKDYNVLMQSLRVEQKRLFDDVVSYLEKMKMEELRKKFQQS